MPVRELFTRELKVVNIGLPAIKETLDAV